MRQAPRTRFVLCSGSEHTLLHECAYYRFVFWTGMAEPPPSLLLTQHTQFSATYHGQGLCLQAPPFIAYRDTLRSPDDYSASQALGSTMRQAGVQLFEYESARDPEAGINVALYTPIALVSKTPSDQKSWLCETSGSSVTFSSTGGEALRFDRSLFELDRGFPRPAA
ncbi:RES family NAD+ phosphorylase [Thiohalobacter sp. IOR34]|nr:RES family NAD+ phosphorylase [Thiohalobacter sp. IOR34]WJW76864.1 RES family NAD+ phosphorylase [Thiohalobacter sp. IOR34]